MRKRIVILLLAATMMTGTITGCASTSADTVIAEVGKDNITADVANFYLRFNQAQYQTYYGSNMGDNMWETEVAEGKTYADSVKDIVLDNLKLMYVLRENMDEYDVKLTDDDKKAIKEAAKTFVEDNDKNANEKVSGSKETVTEMLSLLTIQTKMRKEIIKDADHNVSDEEAAQKSMDYVMFSYTDTDDSGNQTDLTEEEKAEVKAQAENFLAGAQGTTDFKAYATQAGQSPQTVTFDKESASPNVDLIAAGDALGEGGLTSVIETDTGCFVGMVTSLLDRDATDAKKESIIAEREEAIFKKITDQWIKKADVKVKKRAWDRLSIEDLDVTMYQEPVTEDDDPAVQQ